MQCHIVALSVKQPDKINIGNQKKHILTKAGDNPKIITVYGR